MPEPVYLFYQGHSSCCGIVCETAIKNPTFMIDAWGDMSANFNLTTAPNNSLLGEAVQADPGDFIDDAYDEYQPCFEAEDGMMVLRWGEPGSATPSGFTRLAESSKGILFGHT